MLERLSRDTKRRPKSGCQRDQREKRAKELKRITEIGRQRIGLISLSKAKFHS